MNRYLKRPILLSVLITTFFCLPNFAHAQPDPGNDPDAPIDGGISILVAAGVAYGVKKLRKNKKNMELPYKDLVD